ncbi:MAG: tol-pal system YbgF family protein [Gemmatimonadaceae bacterium]
MWDLAVREEDYNAADAMVRRMKSPAAPLSMRVLLAFASADSTVRGKIVEEAAAFDSRQSHIAARFVATFLENIAAAETLARLDLAPRRRPHIRANAQLFLAWLELSRGRWIAAKAAFAQAEHMEEVPPVLVQRAIASTLPFLAVPRTDLDSIRAEVARWNPDAESEAGASLALRLQPHLRLYLLGLLSSRLGDSAAALRFAGEIEDAAGPAEAQAVIRGLAASVRADAALQAGRADQARQALEALQGEVPLELVSMPVYANVREFTQEHARYLRVLILSEQQDKDALRWIETSFQGAPSEIVYLAPMHLQRAEIYERLGEREKAAKHYRRFVTLWRDCDPALQPRVEAARARLERLERQSS